MVCLTRSRVRVPKPESHGNFGLSPGRGPGPMLVRFSISDLFVLFQTAGDESFLFG